MNNNIIKKLAVTAIGTAALTLGLSEVTQAATMVTGTIFELDTPSEVTVDYWEFAVNTAGQIDIDVLAWNQDFGNGQSKLNSHIRLFNFDQNGDLNKLGDNINHNNNVSQNNFNNNNIGEADGSVSRLDSFLSLNLDVGNYVVAISQSGLSETNARSGQNTVSRANGIGNQNDDRGDYQITFTGDLTILIEESAAQAQPVPEPGTILGLVSFLGLGSLLKKKRV